MRRYLCRRNFGGGACRVSCRCTRCRTYSAGGRTKYPRPQARARENLRPRQRPKNRVRDAPGKEAAPEAAPEPAASEPEPAASPYAALKMPEGFEAKPEVMAEVTKLFGDMKVTPADAQKLVDLHGNVMMNALQSYSQGATEFWNKQAQDWVNEAKADPPRSGAPGSQHGDRESARCLDRDNSPTQGRP